MKLIIGNKNYSSWSMRAWLFLTHYGVAFEEIRIPLFVDGFEGQIAKYSKAGTVPILQDGDTIIWDSLAICEYVNETYLEHAAWPRDVKTRAEARSACAEMHSGFFKIRGNMPMNCRGRNRILDLDQDTGKEIQRVDSLWQWLRSKYSDEGEYLFGKFSIADCFYAPMVSRFKTYDIPVSDVSNRYIDCILNDDTVIQWYQQAKLEGETIDFAEVGV